jgi:hypothetical protein
MKIDQIGTNKNEISLTSSQQKILEEVNKKKYKLEEIESSKSWRIIRMIWRQPIYIFSRKIFIRLYSMITRTREIHNLTRDVNLQDSLKQGIQQLPSPLPKLQSSFTSRSGDLFTSDEISWLERIKKNQADSIAVLHPEWRGIYFATKELFPNFLELNDTLDPISALHYADLLAETKCSRIVLSGFPITYRYLVLALRKRIPRAYLSVLYHGSFSQFREDYDQQAFTTIIDLAKSGKLDKIGFVKAGMAETVKTALGLSTGFVMNFVKQIPDQASTPLQGGPHLGMWLLWSGNWQKPPFTMMAASAMIPGSILHGSDADEKTSNFVKVFQIRSEFVGKPLPQNELQKHMARMHINLYVTFHECAPMLPLESLSVGVPCLIGPVSHYFEDHTYLHERLVVPYPDRAEIIARQAIQAIDERDEIVQAYRAYALEYNQQAKDALSKFLELD